MHATGERLRQQYLDAAATLEAHGIPVTELALANQLNKLLETVRLYLDRHTDLRRQFGIKHRHKSTPEEKNAATGDWIRQEEEGIQGVIDEVKRRLVRPVSV